MNILERRLEKLNTDLYSKFTSTKAEVKDLLSRFSSNFPTYTDHSISHTMQVFQIASELLTDEELDLLNEDEIYILSMACILHDIGMCVPVKKINE